MMGFEGRTAPLMLQHKAAVACRHRRGLLPPPPRAMFDPALPDTMLSRIIA